jgi:hypothetical protein
MTRSLILALGLTVGGFGAIAFAGCGSENDDGPNANADAGPTRTIEAAACVAPASPCTTDTECCSGTCDPTLKVCGNRSDTCGGPGSTCATGVTCCTFSCVGGTCSSKQCVSDNNACTTNEECCGGKCDAGKCTPLSTICRTSGNGCTTGADCCSKLCKDGFCGAPSFCTQSGDTCANDFECCGGKCTKAAGATLGLCAIVPASGAGGCTTAGEVCGGGGVYDGGALPECGGECCSRSCLPYAPTGRFVCQPPSGCHPTGEICKEDVDCCGSATQPDGDRSKITCSKESGSAFGRCAQGNACTPAGGICRLQARECNSNANCCSGNVLQQNSCKQDALGIPRCLYAAVDCTQAPSTFEGKQCASSADCCGLPCVPNPSGTPPLVCGSTATKCVPVAGGCTTTSDCCSGSLCNVPPGSTKGTCGPAIVTDPGTPGTCAAFGQLCNETTPCCNDVQCGGGVCGGSVVR